MALNDVCTVEASTSKRKFFEVFRKTAVSKYSRQSDSTSSAEETRIVKFLITPLITKTSEKSGESYYKCVLDDFTFYNASGQVVEISEKTSGKVFFEGNLSIANTISPSVRCKRGAVSVFSIGGYGSDTSRPTLWLKSSVHYSTWYLLENPSERYLETWRKFLWKAQFTKYTIDFVLEKPERPFSDIDDSFYPWLHATYTDEYSKKFLTKILKKDINFMVTTNNSFLWSQVISMGKGFGELPFFQDLCIAKNGPHQTDKPKWLENTLVTPKVMDWFKDLYGRYMKKILIPTSQPTLQANNTLENHKSQPTLQANNTLENHKFDQTTQTTQFSQRFLPSEIEWREPISMEEKIYNEFVYGDLSIKVGDVVELYLERSTSWENVSGRWIAQITQLIKNDEGGCFRMVWLYSPCQTVVGDVKGFDPKELFYTVFCQCDDYQPICCIKRKCVVFFHQNTCPDIPHTYFCRFFYDHLNASFWDLSREDLFNSEQTLVCGCAAFSDSVISESEFHNIGQYSVGDTLLIKPAPQSNSSLYDVCEVIRVDKVSTKLTIRYFANARDTYERYQLAVEKPSLNELYYYDKFDILGMTELHAIGGYCHVEYRKPYSTLSINQQHNGAGLQYFFSYRLGKEKELLEIEEGVAKTFSYLPESTKVEKLTVLDLFCGGGAFGRGLEDTGLFECKWAVDIDATATSTYKANMKDKAGTIFNQSVNLFLEDCVNGKSHTPKKGEVDMILAGNPCQGYSSLNPYRSNEQSKSSNSLLASLASFIEFYEPKYVLMENVRNFPRMIEIVDGEELSPFKVLLAFLLDLGYQIRWGYIAAVHHGCPQNRVRFFLLAAAKGEDLPHFPPSSHHGTGTRYSQTSILLPNTEKIPGVVNPLYACFPMRTVGNAIGDLPPISGQILHPEFPDHKVVPLPSEHQIMVDQIPLYPPGCDYRSLVGKRLPNGKAIVLPSWLRKKVERGTAPGSHFGRVERDGLFQTITTRCSPSGFQGKVLHYQENRALSVREMARGQGFLDSDVIVGRPQDQYRIIGNSVPRPLAFALGMMFKHKKSPGYNQFLHGF